MYVYVCMYIDWILVVQESTRGRISFTGDICTRGLF